MTEPAENSVSPTNCPALSNGSKKTMDSYTKFLIERRDSIRWVKIVKIATRIDCFAGPKAWREMYCYTDNADEADQYDTKEAAQKVIDDKGYGDFLFVTEHEFIELPDHLKTPDFLFNLDSHGE